MYKVWRTNDSFALYNQFYIISSTFSEGFSRALFVAVTVVYICFIQATWMLVRGWGNLDVSVYILFFVSASCLIANIAVVLPLIGRTGEVLCKLPKFKKIVIGQRACLINNLVNRSYVKRARAVRQIRFSYGSFYLLGYRFARNVFANVMENLLSLVLIYDFNGRRYRQT